jgi:hypothetical protein
MRTLTFVLSDLRDGRSLGHAVICAEVRYASIAWLGTDRLDRRFVEPSGWQMFLLALSHPLGPGLLPATHIVPAMMLPPARRHSVGIQFVAQLPINATRARVAEDLDEFLRELAGAT